MSQPQIVTIIDQGGKRSSSQLQKYLKNMLEMLGFEGQFTLYYIFTALEGKTHWYGARIDSYNQQGVVMKVQIEKGVSRFWDLVLSSAKLKPDLLFSTFRAKMSGEKQFTEEAWRYKSRKISVLPPALPGKSVTTTEPWPPTVDSRRTDADAPKVKEADHEFMAFAKESENRVMILDYIWTDHQRNSFTAAQFHARLAKEFNKPISKRASSLVLATFARMNLCKKEDDETATFRITQAGFDVINLGAHNETLDWDKFEPKPITAPVAAPVNGHDIMSELTTLKSHVKTLTEAEARLKKLKGLAQPDLDKFERLTAREKELCELISKLEQELASARVELGDIQAQTQTMKQAHGGYETECRELEKITSDTQLQGARSRLAEIMAVLNG